MIVLWESPPGEDPAWFSGDQLLRDQEEDAVTDGLGRRLLFVELTLLEPPSQWPC